MYVSGISYDASAPWALTMSQSHTDFILMNTLEMLVICLLLEGHHKHCVTKSVCNGSGRWKKSRWKTVLIESCSRDFFQIAWRAERWNEREQRVKLNKLENVCFLFHVNTWKRILRCRKFLQGILVSLQIWRCCFWESLCLFTDAILWQINRKLFC